MSLDPDMMARARALGLVTKTPVSRMVDLAMDREIKERLRLLTGPELAAYEAFLVAFAAPKA